MRQNAANRNPAATSPSFRTAAHLGPVALQAGVPRAVLVVLLATAATFHLPTEPIFIILGIDTLIDMARTAVNVIGNCLACAVVARWENHLSFTEETAEAML